MDLGCNMFTYNLNRRFYTTRRSSPSNTNHIGQVSRTIVSSRYVNNVSYNANSRLPRAFGVGMYSKPSVTQGCGCGN